MKNTVINFRAFLVVASAVLLTVFCLYVYLLNVTVGIILFVVLIAMIGVGFTVILYKTVKGRIRPRVAAAFGLALAFSVSAFSAGAAFCGKWYNCYGYDGYCSVSGRVCAIDVSTGRYRIVLEELTLNGDDVDGKMRLKISVSDKNTAEFVRYGDVLSFGTVVSAVKLIESGIINGSAVRSDIRYNAEIDPESIVLRPGEPKALEKFTASIKNLLVENMGDVYGNIAYSMLTGDKYSLNHGISDYYSAAGLGHIMAVSGLHIGFLIMIFNLILCKLSRKIRYPIIGCVLVAYTVIADFSPSVVRAVIMAFISGLGVLIGGRRDLLSALLCAFSLILAVKPYYLFEPGFLLSFGAIFGIALFSGSVKRFFDKHGSSGKVGNTVGGSVSVAVGILPAQAYFFGNINLLSCVLNAVIIPYVSVVFISVICLLPIAAVPGCGAVLYICKYLMIPIDKIAYGFSMLPFINAGKLSGAVFCCYPIMFFGSGYFMFPKSKTAVVLYSAAACATVFLVCII